MSIFSEGEIRRRQDAIQRMLRTRGVDACFLSSADNVYYVSGVPLLSEWGRPLWAVVPSEGSPTLIGALIEKENMEKYASNCDVITYGDEENVRFAALASAIEVMGKRGQQGTIGFEWSSLPADLYLELSSSLTQTPVDISDVLAEVRIQKSEEELAILRVAADVAKIGANAFLDALAPGRTELSVAAHAVEEMDRALGSLYPEGATSSYAYCHFGDHTLSPHLHPTGRRSQAGDMVALNVFPVVWGYLIELERTFVLGPLSDRRRELMSVLEEAFMVGKREVRPGIRMNDLHARTTKVLESHGLGEFIRHGTGHAHGIMVGSAAREELGEIRSYNERTMEPGMVNSIEPGFYIPSEGGFRHSDVMLVTADGATCLTEFPVRLELA